MAAVNLLPELVTGLSSVTVTVALAPASSPGIALGDALGGCVIKLVLLALHLLHTLVQFVHRRSSPGAFIRPCGRACGRRWRG